MSELSAEHLFSPESSFQEESRVGNSLSKKEEENNEVPKSLEVEEQLNEDGEENHILKGIEVEKQLNEDVEVNEISKGVEIEEEENGVSEGVDVGEQMNEDREENHIFKDFEGKDEDEEANEILKGLEIEEQWHKKRPIVSSSEEDEEIMCVKSGRRKIQRKKNFKRKRRNIQSDGEITDSDMKDITREFAKETPELRATEEQDQKEVAYNEDFEKEESNLFSEEEELNLEEEILKSEEDFVAKFSEESEDESSDEGPTIRNQMTQDFTRTIAEGNINIFNFDTGENEDFREVSRKFLSKIENYRGCYISFYTGVKHYQNSVVVYGECTYKSHDQRFKFVYYPPVNGFRRIFVHSTPCEEKNIIHTGKKIFARLNGFERKNVQGLLNHAKPREIHLDAIKTVDMEIFMEGKVICNVHASANVLYKLMNGF